MSADLSWIESARVDYQARPWVCWALRLGAAIDADLTTVGTAAGAVVLHARAPNVATAVAARLAALPGVGSPAGNRFRRLVLAGLAAQGGIDARAASRYLAESKS